MLFPTVTFAIFFLLVLPTSWLLMPKRHRWKLFMLAASYFFYGYWNWRFCLLLGLSTVVNQAFAWAIHRQRSDGTRRLLLGIDVLFNLSILAYFKYADFFLRSSRDILDEFGIHAGQQLLNVALPVGISFFTFQALSYVIDVYRRDFEPGSLINFATLPVVLPAPRGGPDRARQRVHAADRRAEGPAPHRREPARSSSSSSGCSRRS